MKRIILAAFATLLLASCGDGVPPVVPSPSPVPTINASLEPQGVNSHNYPLDQKQYPFVCDLNASAVRVPFVAWWIHNNDLGPYVDEYNAYAQCGITTLFLVANPQTDFELQQEVAILPLAAKAMPSAMWELFGEPNLQYANATTYWGAAVHVAQAIKSGNPTAQIATGGTSGVDIPWQQELKSIGVFDSGLVTAIGVHPYSEWFNKPGVSGGNLVEDYQTIKALAPKLSLWATEWGEPNPTVIDVQQWFAIHMAMNVPLYFYEIQDNCASPPCPPNLIQPYGLIDAKYQPKPVYKAVQTILAPLVTPSPSPSP